MPTERVRSPEHDRRRSLGWLALAWIEFFVVHGPGDVQGRSLRHDDPDGLPLDSELEGLTVDCYALDRRGRRLYDSVFFSRAKGRDKSGHQARIGLFEAVGPCRFAGWAKGGEVYVDPWGLGFEYVYEPGEPMGKPVTYPYLRCMATEEGQTGAIYDAIYLNLVEGPLSQVPGIDPGVTKTVLPDGGEIVPSTSGSASKDGGKETWVGFDETHLYTLPELRRMYATVRRNLAKRKEAQPWSFESSTMYARGEQSVAEDSHTLAKDIREGKVRMPRFLFDHRQGPADVDLTDYDALIAALRETYGVFAEVMDLDRIVSEIWDTRNSPADSRRYFLNMASETEDAWVTEPELTSRFEARDIPDRAVITLGFDGSRQRSRGVTDATALIACTLTDGHLFEPLESGTVWEQPEGPEGDNWRVPVAEVDAAVREVFRRYKVVGFFADPAKWETYVAAWERDFGEQLKVKASRQHPIEWWMTGGRTTQVVEALRQFLDAILDGELTFSSFTLFRHLLNARRRPSRGGMQIAKEHPDSAKKIDADIAATLAWKARLAALAAGVGKQEDTFVPRRVR